MSTVGNHSKPLLFQHSQLNKHTHAETEGNKERDKMIVEAGDGLDEPRTNAEVDGGSLRTNCTKWMQEKICCDIYSGSRLCYISHQ